MKILITGGTGYIGSHAALALLLAGYDIVVLDNLSNSSSRSLDQINKITGRRPIFFEGDITDSTLLSKLFSLYSFDAVLHFAGLKAIGESVAQPLNYYQNNVNGSLLLFQAMANAGVSTLVFSSSATVYGEPEQMPISESCNLRPTNPYGRTKLMIEDILCDLARSDSRWRIAILRYFNPVGAHESGLIGEDPKGIPNNLLPYIAQVAVRKLPELKIFGNDYLTFDGTGIRDYIHVMDLVEGHLFALKALQRLSGVNIWNLGSGVGYSVLDMIKCFEDVSGISIPYRITSRRPGDIPICYADPSKAQRELGWKATRSQYEMIRDLLLWQQMNPNGYQT